MSIPRPFAAYAATAAGALMVVVAAFVVLAPLTTASEAPPAPAGGGVESGVPIAYDVERRRPGVDESVPPASSVLLQNAAGEPIPTF